MKTRLAAGFTLLEMIAVLAIIAILAAALIPHWIKRIDIKVRKAEVGNLVTISNALTAQVVRGKRLMTPTSWVTEVADWSMLPTSKVASNSRRYTRLYYTEEGATFGNDYQQPLIGTNYPPANLRAMVVSVLGGDTLEPDANCPVPGPLAAADFDELWDLQDGTRPTTGKWATWKGQADDVVVQRINYTPLFHHLVLLNRGDTTPKITVNDVAAGSIQRTAQNQGFDGYFLEGTVIGLCDPNGIPMTRYTLRQDISFVWEAGKWRAEILGSPDVDSAADAFGKAIKEFMEAARFDTKKGTNQEGVGTAMYSFMLTYVFWANECPLFNTHGVANPMVSEYKILLKIGSKNGRLDGFSWDLINK